LAAALATKTLIIPIIIIELNAIQLEIK